METEKNCPFEIKDVPAEEMAEVHKHVTGVKHDCIRIGPTGYFFPNGFKENCLKIYNMEVRPSDVFVVTFPKSGTTWTQELVWLIGNNLDYETAAKSPLAIRFPFIEYRMFLYSPNTKKWIKDWVHKDTFMNRTPNIDKIFNAPSPRFIKSHLPFSLLPPTLLDTAKVVYVARDPRDAAVSYYHHCKMMQMYGFKGDFKAFWNLFITNRVDWTPYEGHIKEAWEKRHHPNMLFLFYEDLCKDLPAAVRRVAKFLNKPLTDDQVTRLCDHLHIDNFRKNKSVNLEMLKDIGYINKNDHFIRKGKAGGWREYFDEEMTQQAERWMKDNLGGTGIHFPEIN
ncbi:sulfotransferase 1C4-like isoform X2 [Galleria mellonella]|uniref:Sulfotransferase 1C4-like isoform X2 n=1 Tax=Galleria mellonella TaxID=7137 RepID=A0ABM3N1S6_GALME|nr:sulfotransferase 1C4-like isoform X2 [Galleria mellonella]